MSLHELNTFPGVTAQPDTATQKFVFNHTMLRVKDITKSLDFYTRILGFSLVEKRDFPEAEFSLYFLALVDKNQIPADAAARTEWMKSIPGILELTHNHGTENDPDFAYHNGNTDPRGFGHICISVPDIRAASVISAFRYRTWWLRVSVSKAWAYPSKNAWPMAA